VRDPTRTPVRVADRDDGLAGGRREDEQEREAEPLPPRVIANAHFDTVQLPVVPAWMQKVALAMGAPFGKAIGYGPTYVPEPAALERLVPRAA
jgi:hypothetical protein